MLCDMSYIFMFFVCLEYKCEWKSLLQVFSMINNHLSFPRLMTISLYSLKQFVVNKKIEIEEEERGLFIRDIQKKSKNYYQGLCWWGIRIVVVCGWTAVKISTRKIFRKMQWRIIKLISMLNKLNPFTKKTKF